MKKRLLSAVLALSMVLSLFPASAFAADGSGGQNSVSGSNEVNNETQLREIIAQNIGYQSSCSITLKKDIALSAPLVLENGTAIINGSDFTLSPSDNFTGESLIIVNTGANLELNRCTLDGRSQCRTLYVGSDLARSFNIKVTLNHSTLQNGRADNGGGVYLNGSAVAAYSKAAILYMNSSTITSCTATGNGGGIYYGGAASVVPQADGAAITNCTAQNGGGLYLTDSFYSDLNNGLEITDCFAAQNGGGIYISESARSSLDLSSSLVYNNTSGSDTGNDLYLCAANGPGYNVTLPDYVGEGLLHKKDSQTITGWYRDDENDTTAAGSKPSALDESNGCRTLTIRSESMGLIACSTVYGIKFDIDGAMGPYKAYSDSGCTQEIFRAAPGQTVYLKKDGDAGDDDGSIELSVDTDSTSHPISVSVTTKNGIHFFVMPGTNIKYHVTVTAALSKKHKITVIGGYAGFMSNPTTPIYAAEEGDRFCLKFTGASGTFEKWVWAADGQAEEASTGQNQNANYARFIMPDHDVTVWAVTKGSFYHVYVELPEDAGFEQSPVSVSVAEPAAASTPSTQAASTHAVPVTTVNKDQPVKLLFDANALPEGKAFGSWNVTRNDDPATPVDVTSSTSPTGAAFTMPESDVTVTFDLTDASQPDEPVTGGDDPGSSAGAVIAGALIGGTVYLVSTDVWLNHLFGFIPKNRIQLALALWHRAGCPEPESEELYPDIDEDNTDAQKAARWCVEQQPMKDYRKENDDGTETVTFEPYRHVFRPHAISAWYKLEKLLNALQSPDADGAGTSTEI